MADLLPGLGGVGYTGAAPLSWGTKPILPGSYGALITDDIPSPTSTAATASVSPAPSEPAAISSDQSSTISTYKAQIANLGTPAPTAQTTNTATGNTANAGKPGYDVYGNPTGTGGSDIQQAREGSGTYTGMDGNQYYNYDGSPVSSGGSLSSSSGVDENGLPTGDPLQFALDQSTKIYNYVKSKTDPMTNALIAQIQSQFDTLINMQKQVNAGQQAGVDTALMRGGSSRYAPISAGGISATQMSAGANALADLENKEQQAILNVRQAAEQDAWDQVGKLLSQVDNIRQEKISLAKTQSNTLAEQIRKASISQAVSSLIDAQGASADPKSILDALNKNPMLAGLNANSDDVQKAYADLVGTKEQLGQDWSIYQKLLSTGDLQKLSGKQNPTYFDFLQLKDRSTATPADPTLQALRQATLQEKLNQLSGYVNLPKDQNGNVTEKNVNYGSAFKFALANASAPEAQLRGQTFSQLLREGDYDKAKDFILQTALETSPNTTYQQIAGAANTVVALKGFNQLMNEMQVAGVPTNIASGSLENVMRKLGQTSNLSPQQKALYVQFQSRASKILFDYRKAMTGVQFSYAEGQQYSKLFPDYTNDIAVNRQLTDSLQNGLSTQIDTFYQQKLGQDNYKYLSSEGASPAYGFGSSVQMDPQIDQDLLSGGTSANAASDLGY